jgi:type I restriction enzyme S subunit
MKTTQDSVTRHLDIWTAADTEKKTGRGRASGNVGSVYGIKKLRELILELAVRGKLVPQDENDEPASELLKRIQEEKAKLIAEGKIKKYKPPAVITEDEIPFSLPNGWEWTRVAQVGHDWGQKTPDSDFTYIEVSAIDSQSGIVSSPELVKPENAPSRARKVVKEGTVIYSTIRPYLLNVAVIEEDFLPEPIASTAFAIVHPFCLMPARYFLCFFRSPVFVRYVESVQMGIAYPAINDGQFFNALIPLPPIEEQHRIVAKVDELMALCDQLETRHNNAAEAHEKLVSHLLGTLTQSQKTDSPLCQRGAGGDLDWQRIAAHFDTLFTTEASIDALKQTLLQLAVMGKLVPQDQNDEPASALLKRIQAEKAKLIAEGKIKKDKPLPQITDDEIPFELPKWWEWVRLGTALDITGGVTLGRKLTGAGLVELPYLRVANVQRGYLVLDSIKTVEIRQSELPRYQLLNDDLLVTEGGDWDKVGRTAIWNSEIENCLHQNHIFRMRGLTKGLSSAWIQMYMNSIAKAYFQAASKQTTNLASINMTQLKNCLLAVPALQEQHRIVAKVHELTAICEQLKTRITQSNQLQQKLADVVVEQAIA